MAFEDYTRNSWKLKSKDGNPRCTDGSDGRKKCEITISGTEDNVTVGCSNKHPYPPGEYRPDNQIHSKESGDRYTLSLTAGTQPDLTCDDKGREINQAGSWSAEDTGTTGGES